MPSSRSRNKFCLSLDRPTGNTSRNAAHFNRWSDVAPPKNALTFAALWDPEEGMVTFSGAELLESESLSRVPSPVIGDDSCSQLISVDRDADEVTVMGENTATLADFQDALDPFLQRVPSDSRGHPHSATGQDAPCGFQTRASSTFDGLDVYSHDIQLKRKRSLQLSCMNLLDAEPSLGMPCEFGRLQLESDSMLDAFRSDLERDFNPESNPAVLESRFSTTTTSTSNYVYVAEGSLQNTPKASVVPEYARPTDCVSPAGSWPDVFPRRGVLRKRRFWNDGDATPTGPSSMPCTPRKATPRPWMSPSRSFPSSPSPSCPYPSTTAFSSSSSVIANPRRGVFSRFVPRLITPIPIPAPAPTSTSRSTPTSTPTPPTSPSRSSRLKLRFAFPRWKPRRSASLDSEGWVRIEITPFFKQRYVADLDED